MKKLIFAIHFHNLPDFLEKVNSSKYLEVILNWNRTILKKWTLTDLDI